MRSINNPSTKSTLVALGTGFTAVTAFSQQETQMPPKNIPYLSTPPAVVRDISSYKKIANPWQLPDQWTKGTVVYTIGDKVLPSEKAKELGDWVLKNYPNWTIVVTDPAWPKAFDYAHKKSNELFHSQKFGEIVDPKSSLPSGNILLFAYKAGNKGGGDSTWYSSSLMNKYGLSSGDTWNQRFSQFSSSSLNHQNVTLAVKLTLPEIEGALEKNIAGEQAAIVAAQNAEKQSQQQNESTKNGVTIALGLGVLGFAGYSLAKRHNNNLNALNDAQNAKDDAVIKIESVSNSFIEIDTLKDKWSILDTQFSSNMAYASIIVEFLTSIKDKVLSELNNKEISKAKRSVSFERHQLSDDFAAMYAMRNTEALTSITLEEAITEWQKLEPQLRSVIKQKEDLFTVNDDNPQSRVSNS